MVIGAGDRFTRQRGNFAFRRRLVQNVIIDPALCGYVVQGGQILTVIQKKCEIMFEQPAALNPPSHQVHLRPQSPLLPATTSTSASRIAAAS
jgi:hypothetical protein